MPTTASTKPEAAGPEANGVRTTVLLPAYNEAAALPQVLADLESHLDDSYEVIVIDDGSTDDTAKVAAEHDCRLFRHKANQGKGTAIRTGLSQSQGENIVIMDADATYPTESIEELVGELSDHDLVRGHRERHEDNMPLVNRVGNRIFNRLLKLSHGLEGGDHLSGLYGLRREAIDRLDLQASGFDIEAEIGIKAQARGLRVATIPIDYHERLGEKKLSPWRDGLAILGRVIVLLLIYNPFLTFILPGLFLMTVSIAGAIWLSQGPAVVTDYLGLSIHSFIVAALGVLAAFQLVVFGIAASLYALGAGRPPSPWLVRIASQKFRVATICLGGVILLASLAKLLQLTISWAGDGVFSDTRSLVLSTTFLVLGLQIMSAALFISIFGGQLRNPDEHELRDEHEPAG